MPLMINADQLKPYLATMKAARQAWQDASDAQLATIAAFDQAHAAAETAQEAYRVAALDVALFVKVLVDEAEREAAEG
ncbi:hypothetical protein ACN1C3_23930 [Pseudomonas sp. H11T01]|uniref:hypothetical protein n=1 Tax=Pseudomonas sp. H11T01 TaxID=3402749 RepID=UPI003AC0C4F0